MIPAAIVIRTSATRLLASSSPAKIVSAAETTATKTTTTKNKLTTPVRTAYDLARRLRTADAVAMVESLYRHRGVTADLVRATAGRYAHARGLARLTTTLALTDPAASSSFESRLRIDLRRAGTRAPVVGLPRDDGGGRVADLAWPEERCAVLCDRAPWIATRMAGGLVASGWTVAGVRSARRLLDEL